MAEKMQEVHVRLRKPTNHPIIIGVQLNERMQAWDIMMTVGNFKSYEDAEAACKVLSQLSEDALDAEWQKAGR